MKYALALAALGLLTLSASAGLLTPRKSLERMRSNPVCTTTAQRWCPAPQPKVAAEPEVRETSQRTAKPTCANCGQLHRTVRCPFSPQPPQPGNPPQLPPFDFPGDEPEPAPDTPDDPGSAETPPPEDSSSLLTIIGIVSALAGAISAYVATRGEDEEAKEEEDEVEKSEAEATAPKKP